MVYGWGLSHMILLLLSTSSALTYIVPIEKCLRLFQDDSKEDCN